MKKRNMLSMAMAAAVASTSLLSGVASAEAP